MTHVFPDAAQFKKAFEDAQENNSKLSGTAVAASSPPAEEEKAEETSEDEGEGAAEGDAPEPTETNSPATDTGDAEKTGGEVN